MPSHSPPQTYVREDLQAAGQPTKDDEGKSYDFRSLRRAFSTTLRACKVDRELREHFMGQASNSVNSDNYTDEVADELFDAVRRLPWGWRRPLPGRWERSRL